MKTKSFIMIAGCILLLLIAISSSGQTSTTATKKVGKRDIKFEKKKIPKEVLDLYYVDNPGITYESWYGLPLYDYGDYWYDDWYDYGPYYYVEFPEYFVVEFKKDKTAYKAIYSKDGKRVATHKKVTALPKSVSAAISKSEYKTWKLGKDKEEIFKYIDKNQLNIYKVSVKNGKEKHALFFQEDGKLLKDKKVS